MNSKLVIAALGGVGSLILVLLGYTVSTLSGAGALSGMSLSINILSLLLYLCYIYGFVALGKKHSAHPMGYAAYAWIGAALILGAYNFVLSPSAETPVILILGLVVSTSIIVIGWQMLNLIQSYGEYARGYGIFAMLSATGIPYFFGATVGIGVDVIAYLLAIAIFLRAAKR